MEYLYQINPIVRDKKLIIYGIGTRERSVFYALLQQNVPVLAFALKKGDQKSANRIFNKKVITFEELKDDYSGAYVVISGKSAIEDEETLRSSGIKNIVLENITCSQTGVMIYED